MDPDETLSVIREQLKIMSETEDSGIYEDAAAYLHEHVQNLDDWLSHGGFAPEAWRRNR